jgi:hypothetical protein
MAKPELTVPTLPLVEDTVLAEMSGPYALTQEELWQAVADTHTGSLGAWALGEADRLEHEGAAPRDAFIMGLGYAVTACNRQLARNVNRAAVEALFAACMGEAELPGELPAAEKLSDV